MQVRPQMKWVRRGVEQGSMVKFHEAKQDQGVMDLGLIEALKAFRAAISWVFVMMKIKKQEMKRGRKGEEHEEIRLKKDINILM